MPTPLLVCISGPTASGKTELAINLANQFKAEIISADSRQFYCEMNIGTAKPSAKDLNMAKHHFIDCKSVREYYSAGDFASEAVEKIEALHKKNPVVIMVGGSGLYTEAVIYGLDNTPSDLAIRNELNKVFESEGLVPLLEELKVVDPVFFDFVDQKNPQRVIRGLEVYKASGRPFSSFRKHQKRNNSFRILNFAQEIERDVLYKNIDGRTEKMLASGWLEECRFLFPYRKLPALNTIGYKELFSYLIEQGKWQITKELIKKNTRNFAKRQITWFRKYGDVIWFEPGKSNEIISEIESALN